MKRHKTQNWTGGAKVLQLSVKVLLLVMLLGTGSAWAQTNYATLKGVILERGTVNVPVEFATVQILPQGSMTVTNTRGEFLFDRLSPGKVNIKIDFLGMETIDTTMSLAPGSVTTLNFKMQQSSFRLNDVTVVAQESKAGKATASNISRQAMDHLQTTSLSDIMQLLPGGVTSQGGLASAKTFTIRNLASEGAKMNSMGTAIVIDGSPISNNANLQTLSPVINGGGGAVGGGSSPNSGMDIRTISTDNIESIEVIRGIPSVEYGDLTSGAVIIKSKAGKEPLTIRFKTDPQVYQTSISKGVNLGKKLGSLNLSGDYAYSISDVTESYAYYQRATAKALYSNVFGKVSTNTSLDFSLGKDTREQNPDDQRTRLETGAKDVGLRLNSNGTWNINRGWLNNIKYTVAGTYRNKHSFSQELLGNAFAAYSMANRDGAIFSNKPGQKVYDNKGKELTNIRPEENSLYATFLPYEYFGRYDIYGKEVNVFAKVNATFSKRTGNVTNRIVVGTDFKTDGNLGDGKVYDLERPPYRSLSSENSSPRPRKYSSIPFVNQIAVYAEENLTWSIGEREFIAQVGGRYDNINGKSVLTPRTNFSLDILPNTLWIRGGYGVTSKAPTTLYLYPENAYFDFVHFNTLEKSSVPKQEQLFLASTRSFETSNKDLKIATNEKSEIGLDLKIKKMRFSVTGYNENLKNGYNMGRTVDNYRLIEYVRYKEAVNTPGAIPTLQPMDTNNIFVAYSSPSNSGRTHNRGIEFDFDLGRFDAIRTSFVLNGAYMRSTDWNDENTFSSRTNLNSLQKNIGIYEKGLIKEERERFTTSLRITHNIPSIGFVFTATAQVNWLNKSWNDYGNDTMFVSYISHKDGLVKPFNPADKNNPEFAYMFEPRSSTRKIAESYFPTLLINFHLTKEIGDNIKASFYANNLINNRPLYESKRTPGSFSRLSIPIYFGFELSLLIK